MKLRPIIYGGGHERGLRSSTENIPGIVGMGKAAELGIAEMDESVERMERIRDHLIDGTLSAVPRSYLNGPRGDGRLCNNANFRFDYIEGEGLVLLLDYARHRRVHRLRMLHQEPEPSCATFAGPEARTVPWAPD